MTTAVQSTLSLRRAPFRSSRNSTGIVKMMPEFTVFTEEAIVWKTLTSRIEPWRRMPRRMPKPMMAPTVDPTMVKPICRPANTMPMLSTSPTSTPPISAWGVSSR